MSSVYNLNNVQWKSGSLNQEVPVLKRNNRDTLSAGQSLFRAFPPRIYRKELVFSSDGTQSCNSGTNIKVGNFETPGGTITTNVKNNIDVPLYFVQSTIDETCSNEPCPNVNSVQTNALKRLRSNGMIKKNYFTSSQQYLNNRNISINRQQYSILREGDSKAQPGSAEAENNVYSTNGLPPSCNETKKYSFNYYKPNNPQFSNQGAVSNGSYIARLKYDTERTTAASYTNLYGPSMAGYGYATKVKYGYGLTCTPTFPAGSTTMVPCNSK
jgi:hypothetical protein